MAELTPITRKENFLARAAGNDGIELEPITREEHFLQKIIDSAGGGSSGITPAIKTALLNCFAHVAWINEHGQDYYDALANALNPPANLQSITAVFNQGSAVIHEDDDLETLRQYLTVTAFYSDTTTQTVTAYTLSGTLTVGTSTITVSYGGKTDTFDVTVTADSLLPTDVLTLDGIKNTREGHNSSSTTWEDLSENHNDFAKASSGDLVWNDNCLVCNATARKLTLDAYLFAGLSASGNCSVELIVSVDGDGSHAAAGVTYGVIYGVGNDIGTSNQVMRVNTFKNTSLNVIQSLVGNNTGMGNTEYVQGTIYHIVYVFSNGSAKRYVNGVVGTEKELAFPFPSTAPQNYLKNNIGGIASGYYFNGKIYRLGIDSHAFTASEVASRYATFRTRFNF